MGTAAGKLYFDFGISLSTTAAASNNDPTTATASNNDPTTATASSAAGLRGSIALPVPVIAAAIRLLPVTAVVVPSVVLQPAVFAIEGSRQLGFQQFPVSPVTSPRFVAVEKLKDQLLENNKQTYWVPDFVKEKRFHNWLENARDWVVSCSRFWGTPLPVWTSDNGEETIVMDSIDKLEKLSGVKEKRFHNWLENARDWAVSRCRFWGTPLPVWTSDDGEETIVMDSIDKLEKLSGVNVSSLILISQVLT
ncbi:hypothetical protein RHGRI_013940 [Rhododendron griersonianum]|uniref:Aminoacyl-tRNA synthetase class Ia domain-containing protein n=1 Tax=Rhododendron griersonianum TaxID=479676 RepID=A0AAV6K7W9_9ERIC|nr:hypothetical protein RHGRI_013940 [Rhododendron griersonianum]